MKIRFLLLSALIVAGLYAGTAEHQLKIAVVAPAPYDGALMIDESLESQAVRADRIVVGTVTDTSSFRAPGTIKTNVTIDVESNIKGDGASQLTLTLDGGSLNGETLDVGGVPRFVKREHVLLLLDDSAQPELLNRWQSKYTLAGSQAFQRGERRSEPIRDVERRLSNALNEPVALPEEPAEATSLSFTTYCAPWNTSDMPVVFQVNPSNPGSGGPTGANFSRLAYESWHVWQALADSYPSFSFAGTTSLDGNDHSDGANTIAWANDLGSGTLGINWCATLGGNRYDSDTLLNNTDFTWDYDDSNGISSSSYSLQSVIEHELGHGLGMGHSDQTCNGGASTPLMCPAIANGVRKTILSDDQTGAATRYPLSGNAPGVPGNLVLNEGSGSNSLSWNASSGSPIAYDIERGDSNCTNWEPVGTVATTSFVDNDFGGGLPSGDYCYRVKALNTGGDSGWSNTAQNAPPPPLPSYGVGSEEHQLSAVAVGSEMAIFARSTSDELVYRQTSSGSFGSWTTIADGVASRPDAVRLGSDTYVFFRGSANDLRYVRFSGGSWGSAQSLGGVIKASPVAAVDANGDLLVAALNGAGTTYYRRLSGGTWSGWGSLGGTLSGQITLASHSGNIYLFGLNPSGTTWYRAWSSSSTAWGSWTALGGVLDSTPTAVSFNSVLYYFNTNASGKTFYKTLTSGSWSSWASIGGAMGPSVSVSATSSLLVYAATSPSGSTWDKRYGGSWTGWQNLGGTVATGPETGAVGSQVYAFVVNTSGALYFRVWSGSSWSGWTGLGGILAVAN